MTQSLKNKSEYEVLKADLSEHYGEMLSYKSLQKALGFVTPAALKQAINRGTLDIPTFFVKGRRGKFALASDVAAWLLKCRANAGNPSGIDLPETFNRRKLK
jgi:hypothetical protein